MGALLLIVWWWLRWRGEEARSASRIEFTIRIDDSDEAALDGAGDPRQVGDEDKEGADDLSEIEGIGPKIRQVLSDAGIATFAALATRTMPQLKQTLQDAGVRLAYPDTWAEQAALAARSDWEGLRELQAKLYRGRRV
jgi:predicted flap endonuclease-1-like 5' DNA nuclease